MDHIFEVGQKVILKDGRKAIVKIVSKAQILTMSDGSEIDSVNYRKDGKRYKHRLDLSPEDRKENKEWPKFKKGDIIRVYKSGKETVKKVDRYELAYVEPKGSSRSRLKIITSLDYKRKGDKIVSM